MNGYYQGTRIKNLRTQGTNAGKYGYVISVDEYHDIVHVRYDDGNTGQTDEPERYYQIINEARDTRVSNNNTNPMNGIKTFVKNLMLSNDEKLLRKYGLKTECGEYTTTAKDIVINKLCADNEATLVEYAKAYEAEEKENAKS
jgi:hypothetical protein